MANSKTKERKLAFNLAVYTDIDYKDIAEQLGVSAKTITEWAKADKYEEFKLARQTTDTALISDLKEMMKKQVEDYKKKQEDGKFTKNDADALLELARTIDTMEGGVPLRVYVQVMEEFMDFIPHDEKLKKSLADFQMKFLMQKAK